MEKYEPHRPNLFKKCLIALAFSIGIEAAGVWFYYTKIHGKDYVEIENSDSIKATNQGKRMLTQTFDEISEKHNGWRDDRIWTTLCNLVANDEDIATTERIREVSDTILDPKTPMGKLLRPYRGPCPPVKPAEDENAQFERMYQQHWKYHRIIDALMDANYDHKVSEEEHAKALHKILHQ